MRERRFTAEQWLPRPLAELFPFFADAANLERITPPWLGFRILTAGPIEMRAGVLIDYRLKVHGVPLRWRTRIAAWEPPERFVDEQIRGPYRLWVHEHTFAEQNGGTLCRDDVRYAVLGGALVDRLLVRPDVERIFAFRRQVLSDLFPRPRSAVSRGVPAASPHGPSGGRGAMCRFLTPCRIAHETGVDFGHEHRAAPGRVGIDRLAGRSLRRVKTGRVQ
jgi:hypothetical protein